jgi:hypothetical protein
MLRNWKQNGYLEIPRKKWVSLLPQKWKSQIEGDMDASLNGLFPIMANQRTLRILATREVDDFGQPQNTLDPE